MKDGWHIIYGYDVYVEDGKIIRGTLGKGLNYRTAYPYKHFRGQEGWYNVAGMLTISAFRYGVKNGFIMMA